MLKLLEYVIRTVFIFIFGEDFCETLERIDVVRPVPVTGPDAIGLDYFNVNLVGAGVAFDLDRHAIPFL
jgi:hypothetical protein